MFSWFQFLIVKIKTSKCSDPARLFYPGFQFLIVKIKTTPGVENYANLLGFNSS